MNRILVVRDCFIILFFTAIWFNPLGAQIAVDSSIIVSEKFVLFDSDQHLIRGTDSTVLSALIDTSRDMQPFEFVIEAHTDSDGSHEYNRTLSSQRNEAVRQLLIAGGVDSSRITSSFHGEEIPRENNDTEEGKQLNRRARVILKRQIKLLQMKGRTLDALTNSPIDSATLVIRSKTFRDSVFSDHEGMFSIFVPTGVVAGIDGKADGYLAHTEMFKAVPSKSKAIIEIRLNRLIPGKKIEFTKFYFVGSKAILLPRSKPELGNLLDIARTNPSVCFEIIGHVNFPNRPPVSRNTFEYNLSVARAQVIFDYLRHNDVDSSRMFFTARGNWEMVHPNATNEKEMQINRRVEIEIKDCEEVAQSENATLNDKEYDFFDGN